MTRGRSLLVGGTRVLMRVGGPDPMWELGQGHDVDSG